MKPSQKASEIPGFHAVCMFTGNTHWSNVKEKKRIAQISKP
jgi:hypothetical protein